MLYKLNEWAWHESYHRYLRFFFRPKWCLSPIHVLCAKFDWNGFSGSGVDFFFIFTFLPMSPLRKRYRPSVWIFFAKEDPLYHVWLKWTHYLWNRRILSFKLTLFFSNCYKVMAQLKNIKHLFTQECAKFGWNWSIDWFWQTDIKFEKFIDRGTTGDQKSSRKPLAQVR